MYQVLIIPCCLVLFGFLAFKKWSAILIGPLVTLVLCILAGLPLFETMLGPYMESAAGYFKGYFLVFLVGALFGSVYRETRGAQAIAIAVIKLTKGKYAAAIIMLITGILTFGGISGFVVFFAMYPIALEVFRGANVPRRLIPAAISAGCWTWSMSSPASPAIQNIIPMRNLGTTALAAPVTGAIAGIVEFILIFAWLEYRTRKMQKNGESFTAPENDKYAKVDASELPNPLIAIIPPVVILVLFNIVKMPVEAAVLIGTLLAIVLMWKHGGNKITAWIDILNKGSVDSMGAILNTALVVGFGGAVKITTGFATLIEGLKGMALPPLVFVAVTVAIAAGACGSASGGMGVAFSALKETYLALGVSAANIHRVSAIAAGTLDTLPHQGAQITLLSICGMTHKDSYFDIAITQIAIPVIALAVAIPLMAMGL